MEGKSSKDKSELTSYRLQKLFWRNWSSPWTVTRKEGCGKQEWCEVFPCEVVSCSGWGREEGAPVWAAVEPCELPAPPGSWERRQGLTFQQRQVEKTAPISAWSSLPSTQVQRATIEIHKQSSTAPLQTPSIPPPAPPLGLLLKRALAGNWVAVQGYFISSDA